MKTATTGQKLAVLVFSLFAAVPFAITVWNLNYEERVAMIMAGPEIIRTGEVINSVQREVDGERAVFVEYQWDVSGTKYTASARISIPAEVRPEKGDRIRLYGDLKDPSFAIPSKIHREAGRSARLKILAAVFALPPLGIWTLIGWSLADSIRRRRSQGSTDPA